MESLTNSALEKSRFNVKNKRKNFDNSYSA